MAHIPLLQDTRTPTNEFLWEACLDLARGKRRYLRYMDKEIHAPHHGRGWRHWPAPKGVAWAVKQYNNLGGGWKDKKEKEASIVIAGLGDTLEHVVLDLISNWDPDKAKNLGRWFGDNFRVQSPKTPRGMRELKEKGEAFRWWLTAGPSSNPDGAQREIARRWSEDIRPHLDDFVRGFTDEGGAFIPREIKVGANTYINEVGVSEATLNKYVARLEAIFHDLSGWHKKALVGGLEVVLASPRNFHGTTSGTYKRSQGGKLFVRATPTILKRSGGYGSFEYIMTHELGHRYEDKNRLPNVDFDKVEWQTTKYSIKEGESFAELFALSHFKLHGPWDYGKVERFEKLMSGQGDTVKPELPEHLRKFMP